MSGSAWDIPFINVRTLPVWLRYRFARSCSITWSDLNAVAAYPNIAGFAARSISRSFRQNEHTPEYSDLRHVVNGIPQQNELVFRAFGAGGATAASYEWDFGDGATATSSTPLQTHAYADATPHVVTLTVPGTNCRVQHPAMKPRRRAAGR